MKNSYSTLENKMFSSAGRNDVWCFGRLRCPPKKERVPLLLMWAFCGIYVAMFYAFVAPLEINKTRWPVVVFGAIFVMIGMTMSFMAAFLDPGTLLRGAVIEKILDLDNETVNLFKDIYLRIGFEESIGLDPGVPAYAQQNDEENNNTKDTVEEFEVKMLIDPDCTLFTRRPLKFCTTCCVWRPVRCSHCSSCDNCVLEFDHHCAVLGCCVGSRNHKYFVLLCIWMFLASMYHGIVCLVHIIEQGRESSVSESHHSVITAWMLVTGVPLFLVIFVSFCSRFHRHCWIFAPMFLVSMLGVVVYLFIVEDKFVLHPAVLYLFLISIFLGFWPAAIACGQIELIAHQTNIKQRAAMAKKLKNNERLKKQKASPSNVMRFFTKSMESSLMVIAKRHIDKELSPSGGACSELVPIK
eukprot:GHVL01034025.1.p1 GENE.GHVL01034025.1~~GHVL01034025.1.p1  ORF type:complete len:411 (+),score=54.63 GHVL01034025.1:24-1256(+)